VRSTNSVCVYSTYSFPSGLDYCQGGVPVGDSGSCCIVIVAIVNDVVLSFLVVAFFNSSPLLYGFLTGIEQSNLNKLMVL